MALKLFSPILIVVVLRVALGVYCAFLYSQLLNFRVVISCTVTVT